MKFINLMLALVLSLNNVAWADPEILVQNTISEEREMELFELAKSNPIGVFAKMTDVELIQVARELKILLQKLQQDFATPVELKDDKLGFPIHEWGEISIPLAIALTSFSVLTRTKSFKNAPDNPATYVVLVILGIGVAMAIKAGNDKMLWVTPDEARILQEKIFRLRKLSLIIDGQIK
jgi:hypothetical protein